MTESYKQSEPSNTGTTLLPPPAPRKSGLSKSLTGSMHIVDTESGGLPLNIHGLEATDSSIIQYRTRVTDHTIGNNTQNLIEAVQGVEPSSEQLQFSVEVGKSFKKNMMLGLDTFDRLQPVQSYRELEQDAINVSAEKKAHVTERTAEKLDTKRSVQKNISARYGGQEDEEQREPIMILHDQFSFKDNTPYQSRNHTTEGTRGEESTAARGMASIEGKYRRDDLFEKFDGVIDDVIEGKPSGQAESRKVSQDDSQKMSECRINSTAIEDEDELFKLSQFLTKRGQSIDATPEQPPRRPSALGASQLKSVYKPPLQDGKSPIYCPNTVDKRFDEFVEDLL